MKLTIEIDTDKGEHKTPEAIALLGGSVLLALLDGDMVGARKARDEAVPVTLTDGEEEEAPVGRLYGQASEGKARRTKVEMAEDEEIEALFARAHELKVPGLPKTIPDDQPASAILDDLRSFELPEENDEEEFDIGGEDDGDDPDASDPMDLDELRAIVVKAAKKLGNAKVGAIFSPYKNPGQVPEDERRDIADKLVEALEE